MSGLGAVSVGLVTDTPRSLLGEGPIWDPRSEELVWVDILNGRIHAYSPREGRSSSIDVGGTVGAVARRHAGGFVLALRREFAVHDEKTGVTTTLAKVEPELENNRLNDGKCDSAGRFWAGTMSNDHDHGAGSLYRLDTARTASKVLGSVTISNGIAWSPDDQQMYFIDSMATTVDAFSYDAKSGEIGERRPLITLPSGGGTPDGMTVDEEGCLWIAMIEGGAVRRYSAQGQFLGAIDLPVSLVTSCTFGGADLGDLYITSAAHRLTRAEEHAGCLFVCRPGVAGLPANEYGG